MTSLNFVYYNAEKAMDIVYTDKYFTVDTNKRTRKYELSNNIINKCTTLLVLSKQYELNLVSQHLDKFVSVYLPSKIYDTENICIIHKILECENDNEKILAILRTLNKIKDYDNCFKLLKFLKLKTNEFNNFVTQVTTHTRNVLCEGKYNNEYLYDLLSSAKLSFLIDECAKINIDLQDLVNSFIKSKIKYDTFLKLLKRANNDNRTEFIDVSGLILEFYSSKENIGFTGLNFEQENIQYNYADMTYNIFDEKFFDELNTLPGVFLAGGSLLGCAAAHKSVYPPWQDIDLWVWPESDDKDDGKCSSSSLNLAQNIMKNLNALLLFLVSTFESKGKTKIVWSTRKNVITMYCAEYRRNIQIVLMKGTPESIVSQFDMEYVKAYYSKGKIYATSQFLLTNIEKVLISQNNKTSSHRIIKAVLKGFKFSELPCTDINTSKIVSDIKNKYYFPTMDEITTFEADILDPANIMNNRLAYMIEKINGHTKLFTSSNKLTNYFATLLHSIDDVVFFSSQYETKLEEFSSKVVNIDELYANVNKITPRYDNILYDKYDMLIYSLKYTNEQMKDNKPCFVTDPIKLQWYPFKFFDKNLYNTQDSIDLFSSFKLWSYSDVDDSRMDSGTHQVFDCIRTFDEEFKTQIENKLNWNKTIDKVKYIKNITEKPLTKNYFSKYIDFELWFGEYSVTESTNLENPNIPVYITTRKLLTKIYYLNERITINKLSELHKYIKRDTVLKLTFVLDTLKIRKMVDYEARINFIITRIDIMKDSSSHDYETQHSNSENSEFVDDLSHINQ
jgi:hypothetical protein